MKYDFDRVIDRKDTNDLKWRTQAVASYLKREVPEDMIPMWIADTDFACAPVILEALKKRTDQEILGYCGPGAAYYRAVCYWQRERFGWEVRPEWMTTVPTVVAAINVAIRAFSRKGEGVIIQQPVYDPFATIIRQTERVVVNNGILLKDGHYKMNLKELEELAKAPENTMMILCSPHNPVGRVWSEEELEEAAGICLRNGVMIVSDEIHSDIVFSGHRHYPLLSLKEEYAQSFIHLCSTGKTFNTAGLKISTAIIPNEELREKFRRTQVEMSLDIRNTFGLECVEAAYTPEGMEWLEEALAYMESNVDMVEEFVKTRMPGVSMVRPEGTFLCWLDMSGLGMGEEELYQRIIFGAGVICVQGSWFGEGGSGHLRLNVGCPAKVLMTALERIRGELFKAVNAD